MYRLILDPLLGEEFLPLQRLPHDPCHLLAQSADTGPSVAPTDQA